MLIFALQFHVTNRMPDHKVAAQENRLSCCENCVFTRRRTTQLQLLLSVSPCLWLSLP